MALKVLIITVTCSDEDSNIKEIKNVGVNSERLMLLFEKHTPTSIINPKLDKFGRGLQSFIDEVTNDDILLVYYAGHGLKDKNNRKVYLETNESVRSCVADTSYSITTFVEKIRGSVAKQKIIIIDSCYSGVAHAHNTMGLDDGDNVELDDGDNVDFLKEHIENNKYSGVYILTSTKPNEQALYPSEKPEEPTFFTGELLSIFNDGLKDTTKEFINCHDLYNELKERLNARNLPEPCQSNEGNVQDLPLWRNKSYKPEYNCRLSDFEQISVYQKTKIENLPHFSMPFKFEEGELVKRDQKVREICDEIVKHRIYNLVGIGGCGKTTLTYLLADKYKNFFNNIAYVVVNGNIKEDFVAQINTTLEFDFAPNVPIDAKYNEIISFMDQYKTGNNLLILDVNETADKTAIEDYAKKLKNNTLPTNKIYPNGWNILILSREKFGDFNNKNLSNDVDKDFLKELFLKKAGISEDGFDDYDGLFELIKYSPLLAEQLGIYFEYQPIPSLEEIRGILYGDLREEAIQGTNAHNRNERTLICFLKNLIDYQKFNDDEKTVLRHFVLWKSEYISNDIISDLLKDTCHNLNKALGSLAKRSILNYDCKDKTAYYKLHGLLADSLREQIEMKELYYITYLNNIIRICKYNFREFLPYADCIGNSLCEYEITTLVDFFDIMAHKFYDTWETDYAKKILEKNIEISNQRLETEPENIEYFEELSHAYNNLALLLENRLSDYESAKKYFYNAIKICGEIIKISAAPKYLYLLSNHYNNLANLQDDHLNDPKSAETNYKIAKEIREKIIKTSYNVEYLNDLAGSYFNLAKLQRNRLIDYDSAETNYLKAIEIGEEIRTKSNTPKYLNLLARAYHSLASLQVLQKKCKFAIENCTRAVEIRNNIKDTNIEYNVDWIASKGMLAMLYLAIGKLTEVREIVDEIKPKAEDLLEKYSNYGYLQRVYGVIKDTESNLNQ